VAWGRFSEQRQHWRDLGQGVVCGDKGDAGFIRSGENVIISVPYGWGVDRRTRRVGGKHRDFRTFSET